ncbi:serum response factor-binding protein 1 [Clarias magur]|uniref:Serum response factor-binding protein 1 n=1 Tax=Clarias magur TaxID=1594786 RepID=A0A8J4TWA8_CLAMG|nr:serum response factor-binding protein 1 [Clarias magur]
MPAALNLSNEVVKMRAEVKRVKVLIIRKLTRQMVALKKKKGTEAILERNQRRAARLLEEIHVLKALEPDSVTKAALQSDISFEKVCQKKDASLSERATARIATHPEFSKRIQSIKAASSIETHSTPAEVVRMRKEVKKIRVLIIRNLTQQITALKKAKAKESELKGNMEAVARLQKEVQVLRTLLPDQVTTRALEGNTDLEKLFQDPESSTMERATARITAHPRFVKKLQDLSKQSRFCHPRAKQQPHLH